MVGVSGGYGAFERSLLAHREASFFTLAGDFDLAGVTRVGLPPLVNDLYVRFTNNPVSRCSLGAGSLHHVAALDSKTQGVMLE